MPTLSAHTAYVLSRLGTFANAVHKLFYWRGAHVNLFYGSRLSAQQYAQILIYATLKYSHLSLEFVRLVLLLMFGVAAASAASGSGSSGDASDVGAGDAPSAAAGGAGGAPSAAGIVLAVVLLCSLLCTGRFPHI